MRLINTETLRLREFAIGRRIPPYAILSHTWAESDEDEDEEPELTYQEWKTWDDWSSKDAMTKKVGFQKIIAACTRARRDGLQWMWVDTNCINRSSSAELNEAINSMFAWYREASVCYVYLADVPAPRKDDDEEAFRKFQQSRWFTRGWTLQELLAPKRLVFFSKTWSIIGERSELLDVISQITGIPEDYLFGDEQQVRSASVALKMSWASMRKTQCPEDMAYCLLGLFDVNMTVMYGEGMRAFARLQEEIVKASSDHTIFCWTWDESVPDDWSCMLAPSPRAFAHSGGYVRQSSSMPSDPYAVTNLGLSVRLPVIYSLNFVFVVLNAGLNQGQREGRACIALRPQTLSGDNTLERCRFPESPVTIDRRYGSKPRRMFVLSRPSVVRQILPPPMPPTGFRYGLVFNLKRKSSDGLSTMQRSNSLRRTNTNTSRSSHVTSASKSSVLSLGLLSRSSALDLDDYIETYPPGALDSASGMLVLPPYGKGKSPAYAVLMRLSKSNPNYCLFFAIWPTQDGRCTWYCDVCDIGAERVFAKPKERALGRGKKHREWYDQIMQMADRPMEKRSAVSADGSVAIRIEKEPTFHQGSRVNVVSVHGDTGIPLFEGIPDVKEDDGNDSGFASQ
jgi:hypothetical protein